MDVAAPTLYKSRTMPPRATPAPAADRPVAGPFRRIDGPTWIVAIVLVSSWAALMWFHARVPWWLMMPLGGYLVAWQFSLEREAIHAFRGVPAWLRFAVVYRGYAELARRFFFTPVFSPVHPTL